MFIKKFVPFPDPNRNAAHYLLKRRNYPVNLAVFTVCSLHAYIC